DRRLERTARGLGSELRVPGFRKGKVPPAVVMQRGGRGAGMEEGLREALPGRPRVGTYRGLEVGKVDVEVPEDAVDTELERMREGFASLRPVERAAAEGDFLLVDYHGEMDGEPVGGGG